MSSQKPLLVAVVGVGLVGSEFISQLLSIPSPYSPFKLISLTSSKRTLTLNPTSPPAPQLKSEWKSLLSSSSLPADLQSLTQRLTTLVSQDKERVILVDNTSSDAVAALYPTWLAQGINVVTPNKKAYSGDVQLWKDILETSSRQGGGRFLNESTVGAGLPVISTLKELLGTGDKIIKIEGVFSGTMSYIFNEFSTGNEDGPAFSAVVSVAREKGYTVCYSPPFHPLTLLQFLR
jgi:homoserine dehydrogenase